MSERLRESVCVRERESQITERRKYRETDQILGRG